MPQIMVNHKLMLAWLIDMSIIVIGRNILINCSFLNHWDHLWEANSLAFIYSFLFYLLATIVLFKKPLGHLGEKSAHGRSRIAALSYYFFFSLSLGFLGKSSTKVKKTSHVKKVLLGTTFAFLLSSFYLPIINQGLPLKRISELEKNYPQKVNHLKPDQVMASKTLNLASRYTKTIGTKEHWYLYPGFSFVKKDDKTLIRSYLRLRDKTGEVTAYLHKLHQIHWANYKKQYLIGRDTPDLLGRGKPSSLSASLQERPWENSLYQGKNELLKLARFSHADSYFVATFFNAKHLVLKSVSTLRWFNLEKDKPFIYELSWSGGGSDLHRVLLPLIFSNFHQLHHLSDSSKEDLHLFSFIDMMTKELELDQKDKLEEAFLSFYVDHTKEALLEQNLTFIKLVQEEVEHAHRLVMMRKRSFSPIFTLRWERFVKAVIQEDLKFFGLKG